MTRDAQADIRRLNQLKQQLKDAERAAAEGRVLRDQAQADLEQAQEAARDLGIDPDNLKQFEAWIDDEVDAIEKLIRKATSSIERVREAI